ncbi:MAG: lysozyme inhibitor LprI family protein [Thiohalomonadales bacterium]
MKRILSLIAVVILAAVVATPAHALSVQDADKLLNDTYNVAIKLLSSDKAKKLRKAQRAWITYRDLTCAFEAAATNPDTKDWISKQTTPNQDKSCIMRLTRERTRHLSRYVNIFRRQDRLKGVQRKGVSLTTPTRSSLTNRPARPKVNCRVEGLPRRFTVQALGVYEGGISTNARLDRTDHQTKVVEVNVNRPDENVVLVLMAYDPVLWRIKRTPSTRIVAVLVGGYHGQGVTGVSKTIPLFINTRHGIKDCGLSDIAYKAGSRLIRVSKLVEQMTGREIDHFSGKYTGRTEIIGDPPDDPSVFASDDGRKPEDFTSLKRAPRGQEGIQHLINIGKLRPATSRDLDKWVKKASKKYRKYNKKLKIRRPSGPRGTYVVLGEMTFPDGLYGGNSVAFLIPRNIPIPKGKAGHSGIFLMKDGSCSGPVCGMFQ